MSNSLRDQLVKAGLATKSQASKAEKQARAEARARRTGGSESSGGKKGGKGQGGGKKDVRVPSAADKARKLQREKAERDKALARTRNDKYAQRALRAEVRQLILANDKRVKPTEDDAVAYNFVHGQKIKRVYVSKEQRELLSTGRLVVINNDGNYAFVTPDVASRIEQRDAKRVIVAHDDKPDAFGEDDEHYAQFKVPDDLDW